MATPSPKRQVPMIEPVIWACTTSISGGTANTEHRQHEFGKASQTDRQQPAGRGPGANGELLGGHSNPFREDHDACNAGQKNPDWGQMQAVGCPRCHRNEGLAGQPVQRSPWTRHLPVQQAASERVTFAARRAQSGGRRPRWFRRQAQGQSGSRQISPIWVHWNHWASSMTRWPSGSRSMARHVPPANFMGAPTHARPACLQSFARSSGSSTASTRRVEAMSLAAAVAARLDEFR